MNILQNGKMELKYYNFLLYAQRDMNGETDGIGIIATEVTMRALLNKQIKESEMKFRLLAGNETYVATVPAIYDVWQDPQKRYDLFMNGFTEKTWTLPIFNKATQDLMKTYVEFPPRPLQGETYSGPMEINRFRNLQEAKKMLDQKGIKLPDDIKQ